jgi:predicted NUDIX family NTP pyrophosphohydrolase
VSPPRSSGIVLFRRTGAGVEVLLAHMGGPYWASKDDGAWSIPKGEYDDGETPWDAARREFAEELGQPMPDGQPLDLGEVTQRNGKVVTAYAVEGDLDAETIRSNTFELEWPPRSGRIQAFPEMDRAAWFTPDVARIKMVSGQGALIDRLEARLDG